MTTKTDININDSVWVRLTKEGREVLAQSIMECVVTVTGKTREQLAEELHKTAHDGSTRFQLWELMKIFGPCMVFGSGPQMFERNRIRVDRSPEESRVG